MRHGTSAQIRSDSRLESDPDGRLLPLRQAAGVLGVHPSTLRRWSDEGRIPCIRTAGGHRRFLRGEIKDYLASHSRLRALGGLGTRWAGEASRAIRRRTADYGGGHSLTLQERQDFRTSGRKLLELVLQASESERQEEGAKAEAIRIAETYSRWARRHAIPREVLLSFLVGARRDLIDAALDLCRHEKLESHAVEAILRQVHRLLDEVEMVLIREPDSGRWNPLLV